MISTSPRVEVQQQLSLPGLMGLIERRTLALRIPMYYPVDTAARASQLVIQGYGTEGVGGAKRFGTPFYDTHDNPDVLESYYSEAVAVQRRMREIFTPFQSPIDKMRIELQEVWPAGALPENLDGRNLFVGLGRVFENAVEGLPHQDVLRRDSPEPKAATLRAQLGSNIYLQCPAAGGELEIWDKYFSDAEFTQLKKPGSYGIERHKLPPPTVVIAPEPGDLIVFNSESVHAVQAIQGQTRVSVSSFIGYRGVQAPLTMWS
ncbi:MAG: 2OG-Fe(II) oxygenase [Mycobacteriaceae bacterium]|nr:2OG-Fe(II) oxygenase [Mycobacteriaceae bacterium]